MASVLRAAAAARGSQAGVRPGRWGGMSAPASLQATSCHARRSRAAGRLAVVGDDLGRDEALPGGGGNGMGGLGPARGQRNLQRLRQERGLRGELCRSMRRRATLHSTRMTYMIVIALNATTAATSGTTA